jgi:hypothetical protein
MKTLAVVLFIFLPLLIQAQPSLEAVKTIKTPRPLMKTDSDSSQWGPWSSMYNSATKLIADVSLSPDSYQGKHSIRFNMSGNMVYKTHMYSQINFLQWLGRYFSQADTFVYAVKNLSSSIPLPVVWFGFDGDEYMAGLNPRAVPADGQWHVQKLWNPPDSLGFNIIELDFCFYDSTLDSNKAVPFYGDFLIDYIYGIYKDGTIIIYNDCESILTGVEDIPSPIPTEFSLFQNYPNPFNPTTNIKFDLPKESNVTLKVYNVLGAEVATLVNSVMPAGHHEVKFDAARYASGVYIYRIEAGSFVQVKKMLLMK